jgi:predicted DNA-binding protein
MAESTKKVIADVPDEMRDEIDELGEKLDLKMSQMVREAMERTIPVWRQRAVERAEAAGVTV